MRDKRPVDELSIEELERILAIRKREERQKQLERMRRAGRLIDSAQEAASEPPPASPVAEPEYDPVASALSAMTRVEPPAPSKPTPPAPTRITFSGENSSPQFEEGGDEHSTPPQISVRRRRTYLDRLLLVVEVAAVLLIGVIGVNLVRAITTLEQETASAQALADEQRRAGIPTLEPTPTLRLEQVVLPGGHIYQAGAEPAFNFNEVPAHLHARVQAEWIQPVISRPPQTSETALSLIIPKLSLEGAIVQGVDVEALKQGVGQLPNGIAPGDDGGNVVLAAHNDVYGQLFRHLDTLAEGDTFQIRTQTRAFTYRVTGQQIVQPNDTYVLQNRDGATVTLISCYPYQVNTQRIVVFADRIS